MKKQELLAPAGDIEAGYAALYYGADAVYLGLSKFSARATAVNFDETALNEFTAYAHHLQRKVYVALNTVLQESELPDLLESLDICTRCRVDGLIIQDLGVAHVMRKNYPWFEMHASTQMAVHNKEGALFLQSLGFKRVVLARELTKAEIEKITAIEGLETEAFIHGALCYSYSGLCQFSALEYGRSANRGKCLYPCRAKFVCNGRENHLFSMKDMALQGDILQLPVDSLKIEGRKKSALYVAAVTDYYRQILDGKNPDVKKEENIKQIFSRPWCKFHFHGKDKNIIDRNFVGHRGLPIGKVENVYRGKLQFKTTHEIARYDGLQIDVQGEEKPFGFSIQQLWIKQRSVFSAPQNTLVEVALPNKYPTLHKGDAIYLASASNVKGAYPYTKPKPRQFRNLQDIDIEVIVQNNAITACCGAFSEQINGDFSAAQNPQKNIEAMHTAFSKTGDTDFNLRHLRIENPQNLFVPVSLLNELRRNLYEKIIIEQPITTLPKVVAQSRRDIPQFVIKVDNLSYLNLLNLDNFAEIIYQISPRSDVKKLAELPKKKVRIALPPVCRRPNLYLPVINQLLEQGYTKWQAANYWTLEILPPEGIDISLDSQLYMLNTQAMAMAAEIGASEITLSLEDIKTNVCNIIEKSPINTTLIIYQDVPLFISVGCIRDNDCRKCNQQPQWFDLSRDGCRYKALSADCQMMVFDDKPYCIAHEAQDLMPNHLRLDFVYRQYTAEEVLKTVNQILKFNDVTDCIKGNFLQNNI